MHECVGRIERLRCICNAHGHRREITRKTMLALQLKTRACDVCACPAGAMWSLSNLLYDVCTCICMYTGLAYGPQSILHAEQYVHL